MSAPFKIKFTDVWTAGEKRTRIESASLHGKPVVVLDPTDTQALRDLVQECDFYRPGEVITPLVEALRKGLTKLANPKPPKPEEPTGLGAVVEDAAGVRWVRCENADREPHWYARNKRRDSYADINAVKVLSEGVIV